MDLREIDDGGSLFQSSSSDSLEEEVSLSDSENEDEAGSDKDKNNRDDSIDIIQERDSEYT